MTTSKLPWIQKGPPIKLPLENKPMNNYVTRKAAARYKSDKPTLTDQTQADDTNLNVILTKYGITGKAPGGKQPIPPGDYTDAPEDLRGHLELAKRVKDIQASLPDNLKHLTLEQIARLDNKQLAMYDQMITKQKEKQSAERTTTPTPTGDQPKKEGT